MKLPVSLAHFKEWTLVGPMGPTLPSSMGHEAILAVDGGAAFCSRMDIWIGDGDSHLESIDCKNIYQFPPKKSESDLALALTFFHQSSPVVLHFWGFLGGRRDHELLNFGEALHFLETSPGSEVIFYDHNKRVALKCLGIGHWPMNHQGTFSLVTLKDTKIKLTGACLYPLDQETQLSALSSLGLSNEAQGEFTLINQGPVMIFFPEIA
jgi:thiamine pyrophosphokinase